MNEKEIQDAFEYAIVHHLKVNFQMKDTPDDKFILFHPYASLLDAFDGLSIIGLIERHHTAPEVNYVRRPRVSGVKNIVTLEEHFEPNHDLWKGLNLSTIDVLVKA